MKISVIRSLLAGLAALATASSAAGAVPPTVNHEGLILDGDGLPLEGNVTLTFSLCDQPQDGACQWTETHQVGLIDGYYRVSLGETNPFGSLFDTRAALFLGIAVDGGAEGTPRQPLEAVPWAMVADRLDGLDSTKFMRVDQSTGTSGTFSAARVDINPHEIGSGARAWMTDGVRVGAGGSDNAYFGLKDEGGNLADTVVAWGDDSGDDLRFIFTRAGGPADGEEYVRVTSEGLVGIATAQPKTRLDVNGAIRFGTQDACNAAVEGSVRYNAEAKVLQYCDGTEWKLFGGGGSDEGRTISNSPVQASGAQRLAASCTELLEAGFDVSGVYWIDPSGGAPNDAFQVFCDMPDDPETGHPVTRAGFEYAARTPVAYYDMETLAADGKVKDLIGDNDLEIFGSPEAGHWGAVGRTYRITGSDQFFKSVEDFPRHMLGNTAKTVSAWVYLENHAGDGDGVQPLAGLGSTNNAGGDCNGCSFALNVSGGEYYFVGCNDDIDTNVRIPVNEWHHHVATYDGAIVRLFIDGIQRASVPKNYNTRGDMRRFVVGADSWWRTTLHRLSHGLVDEVRFYDVALTGQEVGELYNLQNLEADCYDCEELSLGGADGAPFNPATMRGSSYDMVRDGVVVDPRPDTHYLWVVNTAESTISKWDSRSVTEIGKYRVGYPHGECPGCCCWCNGCNQPSRTVVDGNGDVYVANRGFAFQGSVTKISARLEDCVDRNGNGRIDTSFSNVPLDWGQDECILWNQPVGPNNAVLRAISVDLGDERYPEGYVWVGSYNLARFYKLNPRTGEHCTSATCNHAIGSGGVAVPVNPYGGIVVPDRGQGMGGAQGRSGTGRLWIGTLSNGGTGWIDTETGTVGPKIGYPTGSQSYGITADQKGRIWFAGWCDQRSLGYDPGSAQWTIVDTYFGQCAGRGITVDFDGRIWMGYGGDGQSNIATWHSDGFVPGGHIAANAINRIGLPGGHNGFAGVGISRNNYVWITHHGSSHLVRVDPETEAMTSFTGPNKTYTYSDFTGSVFRMVSGKGRYTHDIDAGCDNPDWTELVWGIDAPAGAIAHFFARSTANQEDLLAAPFVKLAAAPLERGPIDISGKLHSVGLASQQWLRLSVTMWVSETAATPILRSMRVRWRCP